MKAKLIFMGMKQKVISFLKKKNQDGRLKKTEFFIQANSQYFSAKNSGIDSWVSRIN